MSALKALLRSFLHNSSGSILPMAAVALIAMTAMVGGGVDMSRAYQVHSRLQNACDAAVLAGRRAVTTQGIDATVKAQAKSYFDVNYDQALQGTKSTTFVVGGDATGNAVTGTATTAMPMLMMQMFGQGDATITASCGSTMGVGNSDITLVLDVTGSMAEVLGTGTRLTAMQSSMKNFYTSVANATKGSNARVRYAIVPFSSTVNVGRLLLDLNPDYLADSITIQSREAVTHTVTSKTFKGWDTPVLTSSITYSTTTKGVDNLVSTKNYSSKSDCENAAPLTTAWTNYGSPYVTTATTINGSGQQVVATTTNQAQLAQAYFCLKFSGVYLRFYNDIGRRMYTVNYSTSDPIYETTSTIVFDNFKYKPVLYDTSQYKLFKTVTTNTADGGLAESSLWDGCIMERSTVATDSISYSAFGGISPSGALDLDIDSAPSSSDSTKWGPLWRNVPYRRAKLVEATSGLPSLSFCVQPAVPLSEISQSAFDAVADSLVAQGSTYLDAGLLWGARLSNPDGIFSDLVTESPANGGNVSRHIVFMTDGEMSMSPTVFSIYGTEALDRRISNDGTYAQANPRHSLRFRAVCDAVKSKGIRLWVIGFTTGLTSDLAYCASPSSAFTADNAVELNDAFQEIARQVGELRVLN